MVNYNVKVDKMFQQSKENLSDYKEPCDHFRELMLKLTKCSNKVWIARSQEALW